MKDGEEGWDTLQVKSPLTFNVLFIWPQVSLSGNILKEGTGSRINLNSLEPGVYFVKACSVDGKLYVGKVVKR